MIFNNFSVPPYFCIEIKKKSEFEELADSGVELCMLLAVLLVRKHKWLTFCLFKIFIVFVFRFL
jgi:hypothetical protein